MASLPLLYEPPSNSLLPTTPPTTHSSTHSTAHAVPPILLVSLDMLPSPLPTHFSAPLHFGHSYIYGVIWCSSPSRASRITAHTELWRAEGGSGCVVDRGIFKYGMKRRMEPAVERFPKNERKMIREDSRLFFASPGALNLSHSICLCECVRMYNI